MKIRLPRKDEILSIDNFEIGYSYSRHEIARTGKVSPLINNKEWVTWKTGAPGGTFVPPGAPFK